MTFVGPAGLTRNELLLRGALAAGAALGAGAVAGRVASALAADAPEVTDVTILQFALTLERFEEAFYAEALGQVDLSRDARELARELGRNEEAHVEALTAALDELGAAPAAVPRFVWGDVFRSQASFVKRAVEFEDVGVGAYNGAAPQIQDRRLLAAAASIAQVEARHAALVRELDGQPPTVSAFDQPLTEGRTLGLLDDYLG